MTAPISRVPEDLLLSGNEISEIEGVAPLLSLKEIDLSNNKIQEIKNLRPLEAGIHSWLNEIDLRKNPLLKDQCKNFKKKMKELDSSISVWC